MKAWLTSAAVMTAALIAVPASLTAADDATAGYRNIRPSIVKIWTFSSTDRPVDAGSGFIVASNASSSYVLTTGHVLKSGSSYAVDVEGASDHTKATLVATGLNDVALLRIGIGNQKPATFRSKNNPIAEGNTIALAGYLKLGDPGFNRKPEIHYPGTLSAATPRLLELSNVGVDPGLQGSPVFDGSTGEVLGLADASDGTPTGGWAVAAPTILLPFLQENKLAPVVSSNSAPVGASAPAPADTPDPDTLPNQISLVPGKANNTVLAIPFDVPGTHDIQTHYATSLMVKKLREHGYDAVTLPPIDHFFAVDRAQELCKATGAVGMFLGSFTYMQWHEESFAGAAAGNLIDNYVPFGLGHKLVKASGAANVTPTRIDMQVDYVDCNGLLLWDTHVVRMITGHGTNIGAGITAGVEQTVGTAIDQYQVALNGGEIGKPEIYRAQQDASNPDAPTGPAAAAPAKKGMFGF